jgi:hypothetical protein
MQNGRIRGVRGFILTAAGAAEPPLLHQRTGVKVDRIDIRHWKIVLGERKS